MSDNGIEDILIGQNYKKEKKKGRGIFIFVILLLICALIALVWFYYNLVNSKETSKDLFLKAAVKFDYKNITDVDLLDNVVERVLKINSETETSINFSSNAERELFKDLDVSKVNIEINGGNDLEDKKSSLEMKFNYSGNKIYGMKMLFDENKAALFAEDVTEKYVALKYDSMKELLDINVDKAKIERATNVNKKIKLTDEEVKIAGSKYLTAFLKDIPVEKFSIQENVAINKNSSTVNVTGYTMKLSQVELKGALVNVLEELKNDDNLLNKMITGQSIANVIQTQPEITPTITPEPIEPEVIPEGQENTQEQLPDENNPEIAPEDSEDVTVTPAQAPEFQTEQVVEGEEIQGDEVIVSPETEEIVQNVEEILPEETTEQDEIPIVTIEPVIEETPEVQKEMVDYTPYIKDLLVGAKLELSLEDIKELLEQAIVDIKEVDGDGLEVTIYTTEDEIEKMTIKLPNSNTLDIEFLLTTVQETNIKATYLYKGSKSGLEFLFDKENQQDEIIVEESVPEDQVNGYSIEFVKNNKDANMTIKTTLSIIENQQINEKIAFDLETEGTSNARLVKNNLIIKHSSNVEETIVTVDNKIRFSVDPIVDSLNQENTIFIDEQPEDQRRIMIEDIKTKLKSIYEAKQSNLNFIDTNTNNSVVDSNIFEQVTSLTRDDARTLIVNKVSAMMGEAQAKGEQFTIHNLQGLQIEGHVVGTSVTDAEATIVIGMYTFKIDNNFNLTDVE